MFLVLFRWLDEIFDRVDKAYPPKQSHKVTPEYILWKYRHYRGEVLPPEKK